METPRRLILAMCLRLFFVIIILSLITANVRLRENQFVVILAFVITVYVLDIMDCSSITSGGCHSMTYQVLDKVVDIITLGYWTFIIVPIIDPEHYEIIKFLWFFRLSGVVLFIITGNRKIVAIFGNYVEIGILLSVTGWWQYPILVVILFISKLLQETVLHGGYINSSLYRSNFQSKIKDFGMI